jgi:hypothetical protein
MNSSGSSLKKRLVSERRRRTSGGQVIFEYIFTFIPSFALILAFLNFGLTLFRWTTIQNAVREGSRYAVTFQTQAGMGQDASIEARVEMFAMGFVKASDSPQHIFVKYYNPNTSLTTPVAANGNVPGNLVEVSVQNLPLDWSTPWVAPLMMGSAPQFQINLFSSDILGGYPYGVTSVAE